MLSAIKCRQCRKHSGEGSCVNDGGGHGVGEVRGGGAGKFSRGNACMAHIIEGKKEAISSIKPPLEKEMGKAFKS